MSMTPIRRNVKIVLPVQYETGLVEGTWVWEVVEDDCGACDQRAVGGTHEAVQAGAAHAFEMALCAAIMSIVARRAGQELNA